MRRTELFRTAQFRLALAFTTALAACMLLTFGFVYWQTALVETGRIRYEIVDEVENAAKIETDDLLRDIDLRIAADLHRLSYAALFDPAGKLLAGNIAAIPDDLPIDGAAHRMPAAAIGGAAVGGVDRRVAGTRHVTLAARHRADGGTVIIGRDMTEVVVLRQTISRGLLLGIVPSVALSLIFGMLLSSRALRRVRTVQQSIGHIMGGNLLERLPTRGTADDLDKLALEVNRMLDQICHLLDEVKSVGDNIAHDLRTPLSVMRAKLERALAATGAADLETVASSTLADLDKAFAIITALLRISEIENSRRRSEFGAVDLRDLLAEVFDLYEPLAEAKSITFTARPAERLPVVTGDRDLLMEAVANLVDNAVKFTPAGGRVELSATLEAQVPVIRIVDSGPGIAAAERKSVLKRFYRSDKSRHVGGHGLGLSLVAAIARLHGFCLHIGDGMPGAIVELRCQPVDPADLPAD
ncbi:two-component sensor histidine kinase [Aliidongia dinghuensis]|uniref:histidine kinase n=1 Tax=Aliidongia dinghuensis TaxID=1867774 RepID=A0A8J2YPZ3_9PROT|nr:HAMP domain-containing sensor histidine kinase [Aliidongia dinghuensis]GGF04899.1 two-component sensor histidine kinase [Aliidongia dinghuensis]